MREDPVSDVDADFDPEFEEVDFVADALDVDLDAFDALLEAARADFDPPSSLDAALERRAAAALCLVFSPFDSGAPSPAVSSLLVSVFGSEFLDFEAMSQLGISSVRGTKNERQPRPPATSSPAVGCREVSAWDHNHRIRYA